MFGPRYVLQNTKYVMAYDDAMSSEMQQDLVTKLEVMGFDNDAKHVMALYQAAREDHAVIERLWRENGRLFDRIDKLQSWYMHPSQAFIVALCAFVVGLSIPN